MRRPVKPFVTDQSKPWPGPRETKAAAPVEIEDHQPETDWLAKQPYVSAARKDERRTARLTAIEALSAASVAVCRSLRTDAGNEHDRNRHALDAGIKEIMVATNILLRLVREVENRDAK